MSDIMWAINQDGVDLIKKYEGLSLKAYPDPASGNKPWTIGYGSTGDDINQSTIWTQQRADKRLNIELGIIVSQIRFGFSHFTINENQLSAMVSFTYNLGMDVLIHVIYEVGIKGFPDKILEYIHADQKILPGLIARRQAEKELFLKKSIME